MTKAHSTKNIKSDYGIYNGMTTQNSNTKNLNKVSGFVNNFLTIPETQAFSDHH